MRHVLVSSLLIVPVLVSSLLIVGCSGGARPARPTPEPTPEPAPAAGAHPAVGAPELTREECEEGIHHENRLLFHEAPLSPDSIEPLIAERERDHAALVEECVKTGTRAQYACVMDSQTLGDCEDTGPF